MLGIKSLQTAAPQSNIASSNNNPAQSNNQQSKSTTSTGTFDLLDLSALEKQLGLVPTSLVAEVPKTTTQPQQQSQSQPQAQNKSAGNSSNQSQAQSNPNTSAQTTVGNNSNSNNVTTEQKTQQLITDLQKLQLMLD
jgi:hypothetical protein